MTFLVNLFRITPFFELVRTVIKRWDLLVALAQRELQDKYKGQMFGRIWILLHPLVFIAVYLFIFLVVFKIKPTAGKLLDLKDGFEVFILSGLIPWLYCQESLGKSCVSVTANTSLVKQVVFPVELLPLKTVLTSSVPFLFSLLILILFKLIIYKSLSFFLLLLPVLFLLQTFFLVGIGYILAIIGIVFKDIKDFVQVFSFLGVYLAPIFYDVAVLPKVLQPLVYLNPFSYVIWCYKDVLYYNEITNVNAWIVMGVGSITVFMIGNNIFRFSKKAMINVL